MKYFKIRRRSHVIRDCICIGVIFVILTLLDIAIVDYVLSAISREFRIPGAEFTITFFGSKVLAWRAWHLVFASLAVILLLLLTFVAKSWRIFLCGNLLCWFGAEDVLYYLIRLKSLPQDLPWLNYYLVSWPCALLGSHHVTQLELLISAISSLFIVVLLLRYERNRAVITQKVDS